MASGVTQDNNSGSLNTLIQGVSLQAQPLFYSAIKPKGSDVTVGRIRVLPFLHDSNYQRIELSGTSARQGDTVIFNDQVAQSPHQSIESYPLIEIRDFSRETINFGQFDSINDTGAFTDKDNTNYASASYDFIVNNFHASDLPLSIAYKSIRREGQLDGSISILFDPATIDLRDSAKTRREYLGGTLLADNTGTPNSLVFQGYKVQNRGVIFSKPFVDTPGPYLPYQPNHLTALGAKGALAFGIPPFQDLNGSYTAKWNRVYSSKGFGLTVSTDILLALSAMSPVPTAPFYETPDFFRTSCAGFTYAIGNLTGSHMGTDSITFGGLKK